MSSEFIPYGRQWIDEEDIASVVDVLRSSYLTTGPKVKEFERAIAQYVGATYGVAYSSGTAALHGALWAAQIGPGDEVLVPTLSFLATANAVLYVGAKPIFVDSLAGAFNLDPADAARKITPRTKAIIPVHFAGQAAELSAIRTLAKTHRLIVVEDAAHALGATYQGTPIGKWSDMTVFSFHPVKHVTTAEGGMVMTENAEFAQRLRRFRHHGIDVDVVQRDASKQWTYDMVDLGYNYRLSDLQCALGISQLKKSDRFLSRRAQIAARYDEAFSRQAGIGLPPRGLATDRHAWHLYIILLDPQLMAADRDAIFRTLRAEGIGAHVHYRPIHLHSYYAGLGYKPGDCAVIESLFPRMLTLPMFPAMTDAMVDRVVEAVQKLERRTSHELV